jgi:hypothetical protein
VEEAIIYVARADDQTAAREQAEAALHRLLDGLAG